MSEIRAFVGHSFAKEDEPLVGVFLNYFATLEKSRLDFSWTNAQWAEPVQLTAKVLRLMSDKNTFIGICTKRQGSISPGELKATFVPRGFLKAATNKFRWKTSDWILQEIGLAIGKGFNIILLVEEGLERPGELQGNIEYIEFDRRNPEACFPKILQMLVTLLPKATGQTAPIADPRPSGEEQKATIEAAAPDNWWKPNAEWTQTSYDIAATLLISDGEDAKFEELNEEYKRSAFNQRDDNAARWDAFIAYYRFRAGKNGGIAKLKKIAADHPESARVQELLARGIAFAGENVEAGRVFESAATKATTPQARVKLLGESAQAYSKAGRAEDAARLIAQMRAEVEVAPQTEEQLLYALVEIAKSKEDRKATIAPLERIVELSPDNYDARFDLAFAHSANGREALALFHYSKIPEHMRGGAAWNNLGVSKEQMELPAQAVEAYRKAESENNTLAMSNLASKLLKAGFIPEALAQCEKALALEDAHKNVGLTWSQTKAVPDEEQGRLDKILVDAGPISSFYRQFGHAIARSKPNFSSRWKAPECEVTVTVKGNEFTAEGTYEDRDFAGILMALMGPHATGAAGKPVKRKILYRGVINGRTVHGTVERKSLDASPSSPRQTIIGEAKSLPEVFIALTDDENELKVMEVISTEAARFYSLTPGTLANAGTP
jgi:tetratricopeptide (TPR) repeat protein